MLKARCYRISTRFQTLEQDMAFLKDYDEHLGNKVQFLLDANLGFINIEQNAGSRCAS
jgi:magnesium transporter